jgi:hypothetical protein
VDELKETLSLLPSKSVGCICRTFRGDMIIKDIILGVCGD